MNAAGIKSPLTGEDLRKEDAVLADVLSLGLETPTREDVIRELHGDIAAWNGGVGNSGRAVMATVEAIRLLSTDPSNLTGLDAYKAATRRELEAVIEKFARVEQAADLEPGSLMQGLLECLMNGDPESVIDHIANGYELTTVPKDWEDRVRAVLEPSSTEGEAAL